ncbi:uncharacterized protein LOC110875443 [Helianthus annuus]|uniref:uncharacterized protein LOC110875443 n=1 Tax=Helianthus annuus TaxID=4232 RepID=UPI000B8F0CE5|nr:uncharacterized protein LOC110875443 [Helianthus annuus]
MKDYLAGTHKDAAEVKDEIKQYLKAFQDSKFAAQCNFKENVESGAYYTGISASVSNRHVHVVSEGGSQPTEKMPPASAKAHRNQVFWISGDSFTRMVFMKTIDASNCVKDAQKFFELLDGVIEEIGEDIVVQVVTDNASNYKKAGEMLMKKRKKLYWTPCAAHCINLMLEKIEELPQHKNALLKAKKVSNFIYNHQWVLSLARKILGKDLLRPAATRFATNFLTIQSLYDSKDALQQMFVSNDWKNCAWATKDDGKNVKIIIMDVRSFWPSVVYTLQTTSPLVEVLRIVDGEQTPAMGFLYGAMDACKEKITKNLNNVVASYKEIWNIIDEKWDFQMHRDLHAAAYYLNPKFRWSPDVSQHPEIKRGLYDVMERLVMDTEVYMKIEEQLILYKEKKG